MRRFLNPSLLIPAAALSLLLIWLWLTPPGLLGKADALGYAVCHRIDERSFHFNDGRQTPLCARCSGMYLGAVFGLLALQTQASRRAGFPTRRLWLPLGLLALVFAIDGTNSYFYLLQSLRPGGPFDLIPTLYTPNNTLRVFTGTGMGLVMAVILFPAFQQTVWKKVDGSPVLSSFWQLGGLLALGVALALLTLTEGDVLLYPLALLSAAGVLLLLTLLYAVLWISLMRIENTFQTWAQLGMPLLAGMTIALLQITLSDLLRLWLTGTWGAFPLS